MCIVLSIVSLKSIFISSSSRLRLITRRKNSLKSNFHSKMPHRECVINKILDFLKE
jgi:uncharacterized alpha/beta hydrolase family protein